MDNNLSLILASGSRARKEMLTGAGLNFTTQPADIDETSIIKKFLTAGASPKDIARELAKQKALHVSREKGGALVIGSDQILEHGGQIFEKVQDKAAAREKLKTLRGKTHRLISAVSIVQNSNIIWHAVDEARLTMHDFDDAFLDSYLDSAEDDITSCVGGYALEKSGAWLFSDIKGDYFTILGMPLLPLLLYLKEERGLKP